MVNINNLPSQVTPTPSSQPVNVESGAANRDAEVQGNRSVGTSTATTAPFAAANTDTEGLQRAMQNPAAVGTLRGAPAPRSASITSAASTHAAPSQTWLDRQYEMFVRDTPFSKRQSDKYFTTMWKLARAYELAPINAQGEVPDMTWPRPIGGINNHIYFSNNDDRLDGELAVPVDQGTQAVYSFDRALNKSTAAQPDGFADFLRENLTFRPQGSGGAERTIRGSDGRERRVLSVFTPGLNTPLAPLKDRYDPRDGAGRRTDSYANTLDIPFVHMHTGTRGYLPDHYFAVPDDVAETFLYDNEVQTMYQAMKGQSNLQIHGRLGGGYQLAIKNWDADRNEAYLSAFGDYDSRQKRNITRLVRHIIESNDPTVYEVWGYSRSTGTWPMGILEGVRDYIQSETQHGESPRAARQRAIERLSTHMVLVTNGPVTANVPDFIPTLHIFAGPPNPDPLTAGIDMRLTEQRKGRHMVFTFPGAIPNFDTHNMQAQIAPVLKQYLFKDGVRGPAEFYQKARQQYDAMPADQQTLAGWEDILEQMMPKLTEQDVRDAVNARQGAQYLWDPSNYRDWMHGNPPPDAC